MYLSKHIHSMPERTTRMLLRYHKLTAASYLNINMSKTVSPRVFQTSGCRQLSETLSLINFPHLSSATVTCTQFPSLVNFTV